MTLIYTVEVRADADIAIALLDAGLDHKVKDKVRHLHFFLLYE